jgi:EAL and modified HD-GYP domain-containing signal transduction protein
VQAPPTFWLGRQPILDRASATVAYELLFRSGESNSAAVADGRSATASVISHAFGELGLAQVLGDCRGFINFDADLLMAEALELLPPERTVVELIETVRITPEIVERCRQLRERGFSIALDDVVQIERAHTLILPLVDIVKIDVSGMAEHDLNALVTRVRSAGTAKLLAEKIDSREQAAQCRALGFDLFQGYFFARPTIMKGRRADPSKAQLLRLLQQTVDDGNDNSDIARTFKEAPELSYKLMRLVNSVGVGTRCTINSLTHAIAILGRRQLQRWLQVLLFANHGSNEIASPLLQMATARGRLMELMAELRAGERTSPDRAFMTGILSLLDALLDMPIAEVIAHLRLPDDVRAALLERGGALGHMLQVAEALEREDDDGVSQLLADRNPCSIDELPQLQISALTWSNAIGSPSGA